MSKDGPPISSGYRHGGLAALRTGLPASATTLRARPTEGEVEARQTLAKFADYPGRTNSLGKPLPATKGISEGRKASLRRIEQLKQEESADRSVKVWEMGDLKIKWVHGGTHKHHLIEEDSAGISRVSTDMYSDIEAANTAWWLNRVKWGS